MKLTKREMEIVESRRKYIKVLCKSKKITRFRKKAKQSSGERKIAEFLRSELVEYETEWYFKGLYNYAKSCLLYFDFFIPKYNMCIEYDGAQHYNKNKTESAKMNDFLKNAYCAKNGINLLRIKYTDYDKCEELICEYIDKIQPIKINI